MEAYPPPSAMHQPGCASHFSHVHLNWPNDSLICKWIAPDKGAAPNEWGTSDFTCPVPLPINIPTSPDLELEGVPLLLQWAVNTSKRRGFADNLEARDPAIVFAVFVPCSQGISFRKRLSSSQPLRCCCLVLVFSSSIYLKESKKLVVLQCYFIFLLVYWFILSNTIRFR